MKRIATIVSVIVALFAIIGGIWAVDSTYSRTVKTCQIEQRLDQKILSDSARDLRRSMWDLESFYGEKKPVT